jgi:broad specificity phosphatase PhoE
MYIQKKTQEFFMKKPFFLAALTAVAIFTACSESSSSNSPVDPAPIGNDTTQVNPQQPDQPAIVPGDSVPATNPDVITDPVVNPETGDTSVTVVNPPADTTYPTDTTATQPASDPCEGIVPQPVTYPQDEFTDVGDVYKATQCNEKVVFVVRHGEREAGIGSESPLTEDGVIGAQEMGAKLAGPEKFAYVHSGFVRTYQTVLNVAIGRGDAQMLPDSTILNFQADTITQLADGWFMKDKEKRDFYVERDTIKNINVMYTKWVYDGEYADVFYDLAERSEELIHTYLVKDYAQMPKFTVVASHDQVLMPLAAYATDKKIDIILHRTYKWLDYLAGVAIIINDKNEIRFAAIKGGETGTR